MIHVSASLLAADFGFLAKDVQRIEQTGIDSFHFDVMDGHYVPNLAFSPQHLLALRPFSKLPFHVHLEVADPDIFLDNFPLFNADMIIVQWDALSNPLQTFNRIRVLKAKIGLCINLRDSLIPIEPYLNLIDSLVILGVPPGFGGQSMHPKTINKVSTTRKIVAQQTGGKLGIFVDGGIKMENIQELILAGADGLIIGTALFRSDNPAEFMNHLRALC